MFRLKNNEKYLAMDLDKINQLPHKHLTCELLEKKNCIWWVKDDFRAYVFSTLDSCQMIETLLQDKYPNIEHIPVPDANQKQRFIGRWDDMVI